MAGGYGGEWGNPLPARGELFLKSSDKGYKKVPFYHFLLARKGYAG